MFCPLCATELPPAATSCPACGAPVRAESPAPDQSGPGQPPAAWSPPPPTAPPDPNVGYLTPEPSTERPEEPEAVPNPVLVRPVLVGDWLGAARAVVITLLALYPVALLLTVSSWHLPAMDSWDRRLRGNPTGLIAAAFGATSSSVPNDSFLIGPLDSRVYPLILTALGVGLLAFLVRRGFARSRHAGTLPERLGQGVPVGLMLGLGCVVAALLSRTDDVGMFFGVPGTVTASYPLAFLGGLAVGTATTCLVALRANPAQNPPAIRRYQGALREPVLAVGLAVAAIGVIGALWFIGYAQFAGLPDNLSQESLGIPVDASSFVPYAVNVAWLTYGISLGAPLDVGGITSLSLFDLTDSSALWWFAPVIVAAVLLVSAMFLALRSRSAAQARRRVAAWCGCFAVASALLATIASWSVSVDVSFSRFNATLGNSAALVLVLSLVWSAVTGAVGTTAVIMLSPARRARWARWARAPRDVVEAMRPVDPNRDPYRDAGRGPSGSASPPPPARPSGTDPAVGPTDPAF